MYVGTTYFKRAYVGRDDDEELVPLMWRVKEVCAYKRAKGEGDDFTEIEIVQTDKGNFIFRELYARKGEREESFTLFTEKAPIAEVLDPHDPLDHAVLDMLGMLSPVSTAV